MKYRKSEAKGAKLVEEAFDELFIASPDGFRPLWRPNAPTMLVTWEV